MPVSSEENNLDATNDDCKRQPDVPPSVDGAWHIALPCQFLVCGVLSLDGKETHVDSFRPTTSSSGSVVPSMQCVAGHSAIPSVTLAIAPRVTSCWLSRLAAETSPQPANGHVPQSHLQLLQQSLLRRIVGWTSFLRLRDQHTLALFLDPFLGESEVLCLSLGGLVGTGSVSLTLSNSLQQPRHVHTERVSRRGPLCVLS